MQGTLATIRIPDRSCFHIILYISCKDALHFWQISIVNLIILGAKNTALCWVESYLLSSQGYESIKGFLRHFILFISNKQTMAPTASIIPIMLLIILMSLHFTLSAIKTNKNLNQTEFIFRVINLLKAIITTILSYSYFLLIPCSSHCFSLKHNSPQTWLCFDKWQILY